MPQPIDNLLSRFRRTHGLFLEEPTARPAASPQQAPQAGEGASCPVPAPPPAEQVGVSVAWLQLLVQQYTAMFSSFDNTEELVQRLIVPCTKSPRQGKFRLIDIVPKQHRGPIHWYIIHTWSDSLEHVVEQLVQHVSAEAKASRQQELQAAASARTAASSDGDDDSRSQASRRWQVDPEQEHVQNVLANTFVWIDICAVGQHGFANATTAPPDLEQVRAAINASVHGSLVMMDRHMELLSRVWCQYESWATVYFGDCKRLHVVFPDDLTLDELTRFNDICVNMDLTRGCSSRPQDKQRILAEVKHKAGVRRAQQLLPDSLMRSARADLRWSGMLRKVSMYCALLLKNREYHQVQYVLNSIPEIHDDEKTLQDIRDVFKLYDQDGSGELDQSEFIEVLAVAGFTHEEAENIFNEVDVDKGGSVSLQEFETWWIESQRQQSTRHNTRCEFTLEALRNSVIAMIALLERTQLRDHVPFYKKALETLSVAIAHANKRGKTAAILFPAPAKGDWRTVATQCAWRVSSRDFKAASKLMYDLLLWNADTLPKSPSTLEDPDSVQGVLPQLQVLVGSMELFGRLMSSNPSNYRQSEYFMKAAAEIKDNILAPMLQVEDTDQPFRKAKKSKGRRRSSLQLSPQLGEAFGQAAHLGNSVSSAKDREREAAKRPGPLTTAKHRRATTGKKGSQGRKLFPGKFDMQRETIVSQMVHLKYGNDTLISAQHIIEAEKSLSMWMAAQKNSVGRQEKRVNDREAVSDFTVSYLASTTGLNPPKRDDEGHEGTMLPSLAGKKGTSSHLNDNRRASDSVKGGGGGSSMNIKLPALRGTTS